MKSRLLVLAASLLALMAGAFGAPAADLATLLGSVQGASPGQEAQHQLSPAGNVRYLGAPAGGFFPVAGAKGGAEAVARSFLAEQGAALGIVDKQVAFKTARVNEKAPRGYVRLEQQYQGLPVFGGEMIVVTTAGGVEAVLSDIMADTSLLASGAVPLVPSLQAGEAEAKAIALLASEHPNLEFAASEPILMIFDPAVVGQSGAVRLVWRMDVVNAGQAAVAEAVLVDAHSGETAFRYPLIHDALNRVIYDQNNKSASEGADLVLRENDLAYPYPSGIADANLAWFDLGDTYDFYWQRHGRDSIDGCGLPLKAIVRYREIETEPFENAGWIPSDKMMIFGQGFVVDDVTAHELTHGVTDVESKLIYQGESGAISESFSDAWGEWIDLWNGRGLDYPWDEWLIGEQLPSGFLSTIPEDSSYSGPPAIRSMKNPPDFLYADEDLALHPYPDRRGSPNYFSPNKTYDYGGVHINSSVGNKLVYLLTAGGSFNGRTISAMGMNRVADLFYEVQTNLLTSAADYVDLYLALKQAAIGLGFTAEEQTNVEEACRAVEITGFQTNTNLADAAASFIGQAGGDHSGWAAACVGDVNGDGRDDFAIGAPQNSNDNPPGPGKGRVYLFLGKATGWAPGTSLAAADAIFVGEKTGSSCGAAVAGAGDVNGDGYDDILIGAPLYSGSPWSGKAYLVLGRAAADWGRNFGLAGAYASFTAERQSDYAGRSVAGAGDVDGDGLDDILIGAPYAGRRDKGDPVTYGGKAYLILGKDLRASATPLANASASFWGEEDSNYAGWAVAGVGDVNGDSLDDFTLGAPGNNDGGGANTGQTYLVLGKTSGWARNTALGTASASFWGELSGDYSGSALSKAGDVNQDGLADFLIGAYGNNGETGKAYLMLGRRTWTADVLLGSADNCSSFLGQTSKDRAGFSLSWAGDVDGDGAADFLIGAPNAWSDSHGSNVGAAYLLLGRKGGADTPCGYTRNYSLANASVVFLGEDEYDNAGYAVGGGMDADGDGRIDDLLIGAPNNTEGGDTVPHFDGAGKTYLFLGEYTTAVAFSANQTAAGNPTPRLLSPVCCEIDYSSGSSASLDKVTLKRYDPIFDTVITITDDEATANLYWRLETNRSGFSGQAAFHYSDPETYGIDENGLQLFYTPTFPPPSPAAWTAVAGQTIDRQRNIIRGPVVPGYYALANISPGRPTLESATDIGGGLARLRWRHGCQAGTGFLGFAWDLYASAWVQRGPGGSMWYPFPAGDRADDLDLGFGGGYLAWISSQYGGGGWFPCDPPAAFVEYSGTPHTPIQVQAQNRGRLRVRLLWKPEFYATWHYQILAFRVGTGWVETDGPSGHGIWHFVFYPNADFMGGVADFTVPSAGQYWFWIRGAAWDAATVGQFATAFVVVN